MNRGVCLFVEIIIVNDKSPLSLEYYTVEKIKLGMVRIVKNAWYDCYSFSSIIKAIKRKLCSYLVLTKYNNLLESPRVWFFWVDLGVLYISYTDPQSRHLYILSYGWLDDFIFTFISSINEIRKNLPRFFTFHIRWKKRSVSLLIWKKDESNILILQNESIKNI